MTKDEMVKGLRYKAANIKAHIHPQFFAEIADYLEAQKVDAISRKFEEIVVGYPPAELCTYPECRDKPYYSIKYEENGEHFVGFGTYNPEVLSRCLKEYFMAVRGGENNG